MKGSLREYARRSARSRRETPRAHPESVAGQARQPPRSPPRHPGCATTPLVGVATVAGFLCTAKTDSHRCRATDNRGRADRLYSAATRRVPGADRSEEHTSELQSRENLVCRLLLE